MSVEMSNLRFVAAAIREAFDESFANVVQIRRYSHSGGTAHVEVELTARRSFCDFTHNAPRMISNRPAVVRIIVPNRQPALKLRHGIGLIVHLELNTLPSLVVVGWLKGKKHTLDDGLSDGSFAMRIPFDAGFVSRPDDAGKLLR